MLDYGNLETAPLVCLSVCLVCLCTISDGAAIFSSLRSLQATEALGALSTGATSDEAGQAGVDGGRGSTAAAAATALVRLPLVSVPVETLAMLPNRILVSFLELLNVSFSDGGW